MIYFDNAATTLPKPPEIVAAVADAVANFGNPARGAHTAALAAARMQAMARENIAAMFGVGDPGRVVFTPGATYSLNIAIDSIQGHIVSTAAEHNSVLRPLHRRGNYTIVPVDAMGRLNNGDIEKAIRPDTEAVVMTHASNLTGTVYNVTTIAELCCARNIRLIVDAAQTAGLLPVDMAAMGIAALCFSGHKSLYGPQGIGCLCLSPDFPPLPLVVGGSGSDSFSPTHPSAMPEALEAGTPNMPGIAGLNAGVAYVAKMKGECFTVADRLARRFVRMAREIGGYILYGDVDAALRIPVVALNHRRIDAAELAYRLETEYGIAVRAGAHCAPLMHQALGTAENGAVRFSFSHFNTDDEIDIAVDALEKMTALRP